MTKELAREVSCFYLSSHCEVWWIAESILNMSRSRADGTISSWLLYFRNFTNFHTVSYVIWTPLWAKCASAPAILSNISANGPSEIRSYFLSLKTIRPASFEHFVICQCCYCWYCSRRLSNTIICYKTKAFISSDSVFLSKRCLILLICFNLNRQLETLLIICSLQLRFASSWTPRSLATVSVDICLLKSFSLNSGSLRSSCGTPNIRTLVLLGLIRGEFLQHHWHIFLISSFKAEMATIESAGGKERYNLQSST